MVGFIELGNPADRGLTLSLSKVAFKAKHN
jgi:hypothetical protein